MDFQDVAFLPSRASFYVTFFGIKNNLWTATSLRTVVGGRQGHAPCNVFLF